MSKKKTQRGKKNVAKPKNNIDINDIDAMLEDMKNLALDKTEEKVEETETKVVAQEDVKEEQIVEYLNESEDNVVISTEENVIFTNKEEEENITGPLVKCEFDENGNLTNEENIKEMAMVEATKEEETEKEDATVTEEQTEDLSFVDELKESEEVEEEIEMVEEEKPIQKKSKRKTYQDMFGGSWRGYGYDEF